MQNTIRHICAALALPEGAPDRIELIPVGKFAPADGRGTHDLPAADAAAVIAASLARAPGGVLPIDFDHRSIAAQGTADSRAAGWITGMQVEGDRMVASVEWTAEGRAALEQKSYRFISPVYLTRRGDGRVVLIRGAGLVNYPALPELQQLASMKETQMTPIEQIAGVLGLSADAPDEIVARVTALAASETQLASVIAAAGVTGDDAVTQVCSRLQTGAGAPDPEAYVPMAAFTEVQTQLASLSASVTADRAEAALERARADGKLIPALEDWAVQLASKDLSQFEAWAASAPVMVSLGERRLAGRTPPVKTAATALDETERQIASLMGLSEEKFIATRNAALKEA